MALPPATDSGGAKPAEVPRTSPDRDAEILREIVAGNLRHFDELVDRYKRRLFRYIRRRVADPADAEDLTQEVFLRLFRAARAGGYTGRASVGTWLFAIAGNCVNDHLRAQMKLSAALTGLRNEAPAASGLTSGGSNRASRLKRCFRRRAS